MNGLTQNISSTKLHLGNNPHESVLDRLPKVTKEELLQVSLLQFLDSSVKHSFLFVIYSFMVSTKRMPSLLQHWTSVQELLKHFWSSYPITTKYLYNKVIIWFIVLGSFIIDLICEQVLPISHSSFSAVVDRCSYKSTMLIN